MEKQEPIFYDIDPKTGCATLTSLASVRTILYEEAAPSSAIPDLVSKELFDAVTRIGMTYELVNAGDWSAWSLNRDAVICVSRALELALKDLMEHKNGTLQSLIGLAIHRGLLRESDRQWLDALRHFRNEAAHGEGPHPWPSVTAEMWRKATRTINEMYEKTD